MEPSDAVAAVVELLQLADQPGFVAPVSIHGLGGIGKTTLAITLAQKLVADGLFADGVVWASLGPKPVLRPQLQIWAHSFGIDLLSEHDVFACSQRLKAAVHACRLLLIVDDVWDLTHAQPFLIGGPRSRTLITTRETNAAYGLSTRRRSYRLDVMSPAGALELLNRLAPTVVTRHEAAAKALCKRMEFLPLGLTLAGRLLAIEEDVPHRIDVLLGELNERRQARLAMVQDEGRLGIADSAVSLRSILGLSVERLSASDQERFAMLSIVGGDPLTWDLGTAAALWATTQDEAAATVSRLVQRGIVEARGENFWMHALLADYATELLDDRVG